VTSREDVRIANIELSRLVGMQLLGFETTFGLILYFEDQLRIEIETPVLFATSAGQYEGQPVSPGVAAMLSPVRLREATEARATSDGSLSMKLGDEVSIFVAPHPAFESWQLAGPEGSIIVCPPDASYLAVWSTDIE
jgi:hypothetical protein